jgi:hypothetical protein
MSGNSSGEKTELPTPKKERDARQKGQVAKSQEVVTTVSLLAAIAYIWASWGMVNARLIGLFDQVALLATGDFRTSALTAIYHASWDAAIIMAPILGVVILGGVAANYFQIGALFTFETIRPKGEKISPAAGFKRIFSMKQVVELLKSISAYLRHRDRVLSEWGYEKTVARTQGLKVLFAGESGTGKTMSAQVLAAELGLELFRVDLATIVSKYIGETEKNLDRIFNAAEGSNAILFFDEADALFGKRSEVRDAHDRYANLEVAYLLQRLELFDGIAMLATNMRTSIDEAFSRPDGTAGKGPSACERTPGAQNDQQGVVSRDERRYTYDRHGFCHGSPPRATGHTRSTRYPPAVATAIVHWFFTCRQHQPQESVLS